MKKDSIKYFCGVINSVVLALENNSMDFDGDVCRKSQMGLITQVVLGWNESKFYSYINNTYNLYNSDSWKYWVKKYWPVGGTPDSSHRIIKRLYEEGMSRNDIIYFEFLSDPKVLEKIETAYEDVPIYETKIEKVMKPKMKNLFYHEQQYRKDWWGRLWGLKETVRIDVPVEDGMEEVEVKKKVQVDTEKKIKPLKPMSKADTIIYLKKWIEVYGKE